MAAPASPAWTVTAQVPAVQQVEPGVGPFVPGYLVTFRTRDGHTGEVFFPQAEYRLDHVQQVLAERAQVMLDVAKLTG